MDVCVERAFELVAAQCSAPFLINFCGNLRTNRAPSHAPWRVCIERPDTEREATLMLYLQRGALAQIATLALLHGLRAREFLEQQMWYWILE